jgi:FkbM family methyltransferase
MLALARRVAGAIKRRLQPRPALVLDFDPFPWLACTYRFRTLIDVGANNGDYGLSIARTLAVRRAFFFEPQSACQADLRSVATALPSAEVFQVALGDHEGDAEFLETEYGPSGSLLPPDEAALREFPQNAVKGHVIAPLRRLDDVLCDRILEDDIILKMDVQGLEDKVILGGQKVFGRVRVVIAEMSFVPLYAGQPLFEEVHELLVQSGLRFAGIKNQVVMPKARRPGFAHCIYIRP